MSQQLVGIVSEQDFNKLGFKLQGWRFADSFVFLRGGEYYFTQKVGDKYEVEIYLGRPIIQSKDLPSVPHDFLSTSPDRFPIGESE